MIRGYFRVVPGIVATNDQLASLIHAGACSSNIFFDGESGHFELDRVLGRLEPGDTLLVFRITDICDSITQIFDMISRLKAQAVNLRSLNEPWFDFIPDQMQGEMLYKLIKQLYHLACQVRGDGLPERTAKTRRSVGRPKGCSQQTESKVNRALGLYERNTHQTVSEICAGLKLNERTFYRYLSLQEPSIHRPKGRKRSFR